MQCLVCRYLIDVWFVVVLSVFGLSSSYCDIWFVIDLLRCDVIRCLVATLYLCVRTIHTCKTYLISRRYQIMVVSILKNYGHRYYSHYIIKFVGFMPIYYTINLGIVSSYMVFSCLYLGFVDLKFESIILFFL